jgi:hypothetical protein
VPNVEHEPCMSSIRLLLLQDYVLHLYVTRWVFYKKQELLTLLQMKLEIRRTFIHLTSGVIGLVRRIMTLVVLNQVCCFISKSAAVLCSYVWSFSICVLFYYVSSRSEFRVVMSVQISHKNDVPLIFTPSCMLQGACFIVNCTHVHRNTERPM